MAYGKENGSDTCSTTTLPSMSHTHSYVPCWLNVDIAGIKSDSLLYLCPSLICDIAVAYMFPVLLCNNHSTATS